MARLDSIAQLLAHNRYLQQELQTLHDYRDIVGSSPAFARVLDNVRRVAPTDATVLISGEPGTGKELVARAIHAASKRADQPFIKIGCATRPADLLDAELFGGGAETGLLTLARGGTLFLDEIGELSSALQAKLLLVLQQQEADRANAAVARDAVNPDARIVAATNRDLRRSVRDGGFRQELFYRLDVFPVELPPLRARAEDIAQLVQHFVRKHAPRIGRRIDGLDPDTLAVLTRYPWPGNVRELENLVERALILNSTAVLKIQPALLAVAGSAELAEVAAAATGVHRAPSTAAMNLDDSESTGLHHVQREHILRVLTATHWVIEGNSGAALKLGMKPATLRHRMKKLGIARATGPAPH